MKDVLTGKSRGFGFVTFSHPKILDRVLKQDHVIDGKIVSVAILDINPFVYLNLRLIQKELYPKTMKLPLPSYLSVEFLLILIMRGSRPSFPSMVKFWMPL